MRENLPPRGLRFGSTHPLEQKIHWRGWSRAVAVSKNYAFVGADDLLVVDIADIEIRSGYGYLTTGDGLLVLDLSDLANPRLLGSAPSGGIKAVTWARFDSTGFRVPFRLDAGGSVRLQRSSDLLTWEDWVILPSTGDPQDVVDPSAPLHARQFYRAVAP